jgi:hypothetical protein
MSADKTLDEFHTLEELYEHRLALCVALFNYLSDLHLSFTAGEAPYIIKSRKHNDGSMFDGYFVVMMNSPEGQISYHYENKHWELFKIPAEECVPWPFDGHTSQDVIKRLLAL